MRYRIELHNGRSLLTDFEPGRPIRRPDGVKIAETIIARHPHSEVAFHVCVQMEHAVAIYDEDCG